LCFDKRVAALTARSRWVLVARINHR